MAVLSITVPDGQLGRLVTAVAQQRGVDISGMNNAQKLAFMKTDVTNYWIGLMQASEVPAVQATAGATRIADISANLTVT